MVKTFSNYYFFNFSEFSQVGMAKLHGPNFDKFLELMPKHEPDNKFADELKKPEISTHGWSYIRDTYTYAAPLPRLTI
jgi:hypothetical protein